MNYDYDYLLISISGVNIKISFRESDQQDSKPIFMDVELYDEPVFQPYAMKNIVFFLRKALNSSMPLFDVIQV